MPWVADYTSRIAPAVLRSAGVVGVCRYVSRSSWKVIDAAEYRELRAAGIEVILNFEDEADGWLGGAAAGRDDAGFAAAQAAIRGYPSGAPIPSSADFNMTAAQWAGPGRAYAVAYRDGLRAAGFRPGVYGPSDVLGWCKSVGYDWFWQAGMSTAWSGGRNASPWPGAHLRQRRHQTVGGQDVDVNDILRDDWAGDDMANIEQVDWDALRWRVDALLYNRPTVIGGPTGPKGGQPGEANALHAAIASIPASGAPTQDQVNTAVAAVMTDTQWLAKFAALVGAATGADLSKRLGNG